ncbi:hypothetical protein MLD38_040549 [Melastoma candidum]|nr:hypothetical protein MLD38_040549 [Melastoma candidum]
MVDEDRLLPIANVGRIMKQVLPPTAKISKEAKQTMQECATEFISFVTGEASDKCHKENRKTVSGDDVCWALSTLGFDDYADAMLRYMHKLREHERDKSRDDRLLPQRQQQEQQLNIKAGGGNVKEKDDVAAGSAATVPFVPSSFAPLEFRIIETEGNGG